MGLQIEYFIAPNWWISGLQQQQFFFFYKTVCVCVCVCGVQMGRLFNRGGVEKGTVTQNFLRLSATLPDTEIERWKKFQGECNGSVSLHCSLDWKTRAISDSEGWNRLF